jgi:ketosteroid isomerase-like protein
MSQENVEIVRRGFELISGDFDAWLETIDPDIGWDISTHPLPDVPNKGSGRKALVEHFLGTYLSGWNDYESELTEAIDAGDQVVAVVHESARMRETDVPLDRDLIYLWTMRDGRAMFVRVFRIKEEALEAAGLRE